MGELEIQELSKRDADTAVDELLKIADYPADVAVEGRVVLVADPSDALIDVMLVAAMNGHVIAAWVCFLRPNGYGMAFLNMHATGPHEPAFVCFDTDDDGDFLAAVAQYGTVTLECAGLLPVTIRCVTEGLGRMLRERARIVGEG